MGERALRVLMVDDDEEFVNAVERRLSFDGFEFKATTSAMTVRSLMKTFRPDLALLDVNLPLIAGNELLGLARFASETDGAVTRFVLFSSVDDATLVRMARETKADGWLSKSTPFDELGKRLRKIAGR